MNRLLCGSEVEMVEKHEPCHMCDGVGGWYVDKETEEEVTREYYLAHRDTCTTEYCEYCKGKGYNVEYVYPEVEMAGWGDRYY